MADKKISELIEALNLKDTDILVIVQDNTTKKITVANAKEMLKGADGQQGPPGTPAKNYIIETTNITVGAEIEQNTNYEVPIYEVGTNSLSIYFEGNKLIKDINYIEVDSTHIQFKDWNVPIDSNLEIIIRKEEE